MRSKTQVPAILKNKWVLGALAVGAVMLLSKKSGAVLPQGAVATRPTAKPAAVAAGETVSASTFRMIQARRANFVYVPATMKGNMLTFKSPVRGLFTRNIVKIGSNILAEIQRQ